MEWSVWSRYYVLAFYIPLPPVGEPLSLELSLPSLSLPCLRSSLILLSSTSFFAESLITL